uniref:Uncharacterized protein n=1 Tax=Acrobeloides nanus TaxID=290746 RepID=A0A914E2U1_9BILA
MVLLIKPYREAALHLRHFQYAHSRVRALSNPNATQLLCVNVAATVRRLELNDNSTAGNQNVQQTTRNVIVIRSNL